jgi:hypothetical protein
VQRGGVGALVGVLGDAEHAVLGIHAVETAVLVHPQPRDVIAVEGDVVTVPERVRGQHHRQVGLARGAGEATADVVVLPGLLVVDADEHVLLGEELLGGPAVVGALPESVRDLAEQRVAAVRRTEVEDRALVTDRDEVATVLRRPLAELGQVTCDVYGADELIADVVDVLRADASHADHVQDDGAGVGELHPGRPRGEVVAGG